MFSQLNRWIEKKRMVTAFLMVLSLALIGATSYLLAEKAAVEKEKTTGKGYLGVMVSPLSTDEEKEPGVDFGVQITQVMKGKAAEKAGLQKGDIIQYFNDEKIRDTEDLIEAVRECAPNTQAKVKAFRDGKEKVFTVTLEKYKSSDYSFNFLSKDGKEFSFFSNGSGYIGVQLQDLNKDLAEYFGVGENGGALVMDVAKDSPAAKAGLKSGDVIVQIDGKAVKNPGDAIETAAKSKAGDSLDIQVIRHKNKQTVKVEVAERPGLKDLGFFKELGEGLEGIRVRIPRVHYFNVPIPQIDKEELYIMRGKLKKELDENLKKELENLKQQKEKIKKELKEVKKTTFIYI